jgi:hypothetical protein
MLQSTLDQINRNAYNKVYSKSSNFPKPKQGCFPVVILVSLTVLIIILLIFLSVKPKCVQDKDDSDKLDMKKVSLYSVVPTIVVMAIGSTMCFV